jgi:hypothetical protein
MKIEIHSIENSGTLDKEVVWLNVLEDISDLSYYMICDTTYTDKSHISNELRHIYWFPAVAVKKHDWIAVRTTEGKNQTVANNRGTTTHIFYWNLGRTIWNKEGDCAVVFELETWNAHKAERAKSAA